ncbi:hypothetical protein GGF48_001157 [Coemansia sp. RSA 921]|nr:hypothetical protein GGF48_001157 [Coemansia sp. RSA 921]
MSTRVNKHGSAGRKLRVAVNHVEFTKYSEREIIQYDIELQPEGTEFKKLPPPELMRSVFDQCMRIHRASRLGNTHMVYDARKIAYAPRRVCGPTETLRLEVSHSEAGRASKYIVQIREAAVIDPSSVTRFIRGDAGTEMADIQPALTAMDLAIGSVAHQDMVGFGRSFFTRAQSMPTSGGLELWRGFSLSVRPGMERLFLNVNTAVTAMYMPGSLLNALLAVFDLQSAEQLRGHIDQSRAREMSAYLRGLTLYLRHRGITGKRKFAVKGITSAALDRESFEWEDPDRPGHPETVSIAQYYAKRYNIKLRYPYLPGLVGRKNAIFPIELCEVAENQRYRGKLDDRQTADMVRFACQRPDENRNRIEDVLKQLNFAESPVTAAFGLTLTSRLAEVESRVLPAPTINYGRASQEPTLSPASGAWNMRGKRVSTPGASLEFWAVLVLSRQRDLPMNRVQAFVTMLVDTCIQTGYDIRQSRPPIVYGNLNADLGREMRHACDAINLPPKRPPQLLLVVLPSTNAHVYQTIKNCAYTTLGIQTQCMQAKNMQRPSTQYCANLCLKINTKLGGTNQALTPSHLQKLVHNKPTLFMGCDVTHPAPGEQHKPSIASVVGSTDFMGLRYSATLIQLPSRQELVSKLQDAVVRHLKLFFKGTKTKPRHIIFYRDGVGETQFSQVRDRELIEIQRACSSVEPGYKPEITFLADLLWMSREMTTNAVMKFTSRRRKNKSLLDISAAIGADLRLYMQTLGMIRELFLETNNPAFGTLRLDLVMLMHENDVSDIIGDDICHGLAWPLDACITKQLMDDRRVQELQSYFDRFNNENMPYGEISLILSSPYSRHVLAQYVLSILEAIAPESAVSQRYKELKFPRVLLTMGLSAQELIQQDHPKIPKDSRLKTREFFQSLLVHIEDTAAQPVPEATSILTINGIARQVLYTFVLKLAANQNMDALNTWLSVIGDFLHSALGISSETPPYQISLDAQTESRIPQAIPVSHNIDAFELDAFIQSIMSTVALWNPSNSRL